MFSTLQLNIEIFQRSTIPAVETIYQFDEFATIQYKVSSGSTQSRKTLKLVHATKKFWGTPAYMDGNNHELIFSRRE